MSDPRLRRAVHIYNTVLQRTGDRNLAARAVQATIQMPQTQTSSGMLGTVQAQPFGRFGRPEPSLTNQQPNGVMNDIRNFGREAFRTLPVTGEIAAGVDAAKSLGKGDYLGAAGAAALAIPFAGSIGRRMGGWVPKYKKLQKDLDSLRALSADRPFGTPPSRGAGFSAADLDKLQTTQARPHVVDPDKAMPPFVPDGQGRLVNSRNMKSADEASAGLLSGSNISGKPPPKPKRDQSSTFTSKKKDALVNTFDANGRTITLEQAREAAPGVPDAKLQNAIDKLNKASKGLKKNMSAKDMRELFKLSLIGIGGGAGLLSGAFEQ